MSNQVANTSINNGVSIEKLAKEIVTSSYRNSMAYTKAVESEALTDRIERISDAMNEIDMKNAAAYAYIQSRPTAFK